jgi:hypothetical protein
MTAKVLALNVSAGLVIGDTETGGVTAGGLVVVHATMPKTIDTSRLMRANNIEGD